MVGHSGQQAQNSLQIFEVAPDKEQRSSYFRSSDITCEQSIAYRKAYQQVLSMYKMPIVPRVQ